MTDSTRDGADAEDARRILTALAEAREEARKDADEAEDSA